MNNMTNPEINIFAQDDEFLQIKKSLRNDCLKTGALLLIYEILQIWFSNLFYYAAYFFLTKKLSFDFSVIKKYFRENISVLTSTTFSMTKMISITTLCLLIIFLIGKFVFKLQLGKYLKPCKSAVKTGFTWFTGCYLANMFFSLLVSYIVLMISNSGISVPGSDLSIKSPSVAALIFQFAYTIIIAPLIEEFIYRGIILGVLSKYSKWGAVVISALAFGLMHGNIEQAVSAFAMGLIYGAIAVKNGSIIPTIIIHSLNNLFAGFTNFATVMKIPYYETIYSVLVIIISLIGLYVLCTRLKSLSLKSIISSPDTERKAAKSMLLNPMILLYFAFLIFLMVYTIVIANAR